MATAKAFVPTPSPTTFSLVLTQGEANTLNAICNMIGGNQVISRRLHMDAIGRALQSTNAIVHTPLACKFDQTTIHLKEEREEIPV